MEIQNFCALHIRPRGLGFRKINFFLYFFVSFSKFSKWLSKNLSWSLSVCPFSLSLSLSHFSVSFSLSLSIYHIRWSLTRTLLFSSEHPASPQWPVLDSKLLEQAEKKAALNNAFCEKTTTIDQFSRCLSLMTQSVNGIGITNRHRYIWSKKPLSLIIEKPDFKRSRTKRMIFHPFRTHQASCFNGLWMYSQS